MHGNIFFTAMYVDCYRIRHRGAIVAFESGRADLTCYSDLCTSYVTRGAVCTDFPPAYGYGAPKWFGPKLGPRPGSKLEFKFGA